MTRRGALHREDDEEDLLPEDVDAAVAVGEEEHVVVVAPGDLVHLKLELLLGSGAVRPRVDEGHHVVLVAHGNRLAIRAPADVDVLPWRTTEEHVVL